MRWRSSRACPPTAATGPPSRSASPPSSCPSSPGALFALPYRGGPLRVVFPRQGELAGERLTMATVEQHAAETHDGVADAAATGRGIPVENPATGEIIATVPDLDAATVAAMAARARAVQPEWEAYGFEVRARILLRGKKWVMDNAPQIVNTICSETGKTFEDAQLAEIGYAGNAFGFWARAAPNY